MGLEPTTFALRTRRSPKLSYVPGSTTHHRSDRRSHVKNPTSQKLTCTPFLRACSGEPCMRDYSRPGNGPSLFVTSKNERFAGNSVRTRLSIHRRGTRICFMGWPSADCKGYRPFGCRPFGEKHGLSGTFLANLFRMSSMGIDSSCEIGTRQSSLRLESDARHRGDQTCFFEGRFHIGLARLGKSCATAPDQVST